MNKIFPIQQWFYPVVFLAVFLRLLVRLLQQIKHMHGTDFYDVTLWSALAAVLCFHVVLLVIASSSQKFKDHSGPLIYIGLLLILYLSILIDHCFLHWPEPLILGLTLMGSIIFLYYRSPVQLPPFHWQWEDALIFLWLANSLLFFLEYNFDAHRVLYQDEGTFWYAAAANMVHQGTLKAQILGYPGGGLHPFGIPFIAALPLLFCKAIPMAGLYFMPVIILLMGSAFLNRIKKEPWIFIFFLTALFCAFNDV